MKSMKLRGVFLAVTGALALSFSAGANADATFDLVQALVQKGVLTEEEALPLLAGRENDIKNADKKVKKAARVTISDAIDNATVYGDVRVRSEYRQGSGSGAAGIAGEEERLRGRYKLTFGVETKADDFYTDLAFSMGAGGRSDNATFAGGNPVAGTSNPNGANNKETLYVKRAMVGWKMTDWLAVEAGRIKNPLYTTSMVWDGDLTFEGAAEKVSYDYNKINFFGNFVQSQYIGDYKNFSGNAGLSAGDRFTNNILAFQGGLKFPITDMISAKAAITYTTYSGSKSTGAGTQTPFVPALATRSAGVSGLNTSTNDLNTIEIPAEIEFKTTGNLSYKVFGDYVYNTSGDERFNQAVANSAAGATRNAVRAAGNDDTAWLVGASIASAKDKKPQKGDWNAKVWWQDVGVYAVDQNAVDSDLMDSRVNMKGLAAKAQYNLRDNVFVDVTGATATRKNGALATAGTASDIGLDLNRYQLLQLDLTYKF
ncbi:MAG: putative porin [Methylophilaceae bacterium]|nr:putative porin [Methyloradius sp.]